MGDEASRPGAAGRREGRFYSQFPRGGAHHARQDPPGSTRAPRERGEPRTRPFIVASTGGTGEEGRPGWAGG